MDHLLVTRGWWAYLLATSFGVPPSFAEKIMFTSECRIKNSKSLSTHKKSRFAFRKKSLGLVLNGINQIHP